jgi:hypothetical protein
MNDDPYVEDIYEQNLAEFKETFPSYFTKKSPSIPKNHDEIEDTDSGSDEEDEILVPAISPSLENLIPEFTSTNDEEFEIIVPAKKKKKNLISPIIPNTPAPSLSGFAYLPYQNLLQKEIGETEEMYQCRVKISQLLSEVKIPYNDGFAFLDSLAIISYSRMINNHLWLNVAYEKDKQNDMIKVMTMIGL